MQASPRRAANLLAAGICLLFIASLLLRSRAAQPQSGPHATNAAHPNAAEAFRQNTLGVAYMNQQRPADAQKYFEHALALDPHFEVARLNLGISLLAQQKLEPARTALAEASEKLPNDPYAWYNLGLTYKDLGDAEKGIEAFSRVTQIANEADPWYFVGYLNSQLQHYDLAIAAFQKALALFPFHASAEFGLARAYQRGGNTEAAREHLAKFQKITAEHLGTPFGAGYGDQGRFSLAELPRSAAQNAPPAIPVHFTQQYVSSLVAQPIGAVLALPMRSPVPVGPSYGACFLDYDGDGQPDLFLVSSVARNDQPGVIVRGDLVTATSHVLHNLGNGKFADVTKAAGLERSAAGFGCAAGDFDNDGHTDLAVCYSDGVHLFHNNGAGKFEDVTEQVGIRREPGCVSVTFADYDHDGDLDLYVTMQPSAGTSEARAHNVLWRNNGNSTFTDVSAETALGIDATGAGVVTTDFNNDRAIDFVVAGGDNGASILLNPREGKFAPLQAIDFKKEDLPPAVGVVAFDFNKDGWMDLAFTHAGAPGISLWRNVDGKHLERVPLPDFGWIDGWGISAIDYDNDGWVDLVAVGETKDRGQIRLLRNLGAKGWADATKETRLDTVKLSRPRAIAVADLDGNGAADLVVTQLGGPPLLLKNEGSNAHNWMDINLKALADNKSGIGTKVELYAGALYQKWEMQGASGYLGQNAPTILAGLGEEKNADVMRLLWPTGVPQDEVNLAARKTQLIAELDRRGSSCPVLFSWNGKEYEFIADMIGPGVVGHWVGSGAHGVAERDVPDPDEYLKVGATSVQPLDGMLSFRFLEPMEETVYLDQLRLVAVDHPSNYEVFPNERFVSNPPFPDFRVIAVRDARPPRGAWDDRGNDVLPLISKRDRKYVTDFESLPFAGFAKLHWLELDLGAWDAAKPLRLILDGYTDYFTATSMYAADQANAKVIAPYVEALDAQGKWVRVVDDMGFPAGLERTMIANLTGKLPAGTRRIRIVTNLKIYWDAIRIDQTSDTKEIRTEEVPLTKASLEFVGYPREIRLTPVSDTAYSFANRSMTGPYARAAGNYTRYGDVLDLLRAADDRFVVFGSGEGVKVDFDPRDLPTLPAGWTRDYFFYANGFEKDLDFYAAHAFTVEPLPRHGLMAYPYPAGQEYPSDAQHLGYELEYNTRERSGKMPPSLSYHYRQQK
ncbi:MAG TPA: FG-GAP-like repeat-containing protein [Candidatus Methylomirabilis sp.]|nr:FG-GAP-like repeat-containing protein [Candidatus Methylomirabilis sp.]